MEELNLSDRRKLSMTGFGNILTLIYILRVEQQFAAQMI